MSNTTRRNFLKRTAITAPMVIGGLRFASPFIIPRSVLGQDGKPGANDTVKVGIIGLGGRCNWILRNEINPASKPSAGFKIVALSDLVQQRIDRFMEQFKADYNLERTYTDFRKMIETEKLDGVMVETATHQRAWTTVIAMQMGCHTYIEKPMALTVAEGRYLVNAARKYKRVTQVGTQQRSLPLCKWACKQVQDGVLGKVKVVEAPNFYGPNQWDEAKAGQPYIDGITDDIWDAWTNQVKLRPFHSDIYRGWSMLWDYDSGGQDYGVTGWGTHSYDQVNMALGTSETGPTEILLEEPCTMQDRGPRAKMTMKFASGVEVRLHLNRDRGPGLGCIVIGDKAKLEINRHKLASNPADIVTNMPDEAKNVRPESLDHIENWIECIRSGAKCNADIEIGQRSTTLCQLVNIVRSTAEVGKVIGWDSEQERFTNNDAGNAMLSRPRRKGWELPALG